MLQQTTVAAVEPYFRRLVARWPDVDALARAGLDEVLHAWQGLGYYARARNLHECARVVSRELGGGFPATEEGLMRLPGIGPYTAAAIAAIAFQRPVVVVDGNVARVVARLYGVAEPLPAAKRRIRDLAAALTPALRPGDYAQGVMDLGATVCTPRRPACGRCPWAGSCVARAQGVAESLPRRAPRQARPTRRGVAFWMVREDGAVWLRRRAEAGLLGGMMEVPSTEWRERVWTRDEAREAAPHLPLPGSTVRWHGLPGLVRHTFTHFHLEIAVLAARVPAPEAEAGAASGRTAKGDAGKRSGGKGGAGKGADGALGGTWVQPARLGDLALPTVMKKIIRHALAAA
jgi:A/G-specific adenine glycosylase